MHEVWGDKIDEQKIFPKNNLVFIFINLKSLPYSIIISILDQNISDLIVSLIFFSINKENLTIKNFKYQIDYLKVLSKKQFLNRDIYIPIIKITKK